MVEIRPCAYYNKLGLPDQNGELEGGACIWFVRKNENNQKEILFQKRSKNIHNGGYYDASAGGHIDKGEDPLTTAIREAKEEIGLTINPDELIYVTTYATDKKLITVYVSDRTGKNDELTLDENEVESVEWVKPEDLDTFTQTHAKPPLRNLLPHIPVLRYYIENYL